MSEESPETPELPPAVAARLRHWRRLAIVNTVVAVGVAVLAVLALHFPAAAVVILLMAVSIANTWYLDRRFRRSVR